MHPLARASRKPASSCSRGTAGSHRVPTLTHGVTEDDAERCLSRPESCLRGEGEGANDNSPLRCVAAPGIPARAARGNGVPPGRAVAASTALLKAASGSPLGRAGDAMSAPEEAAGGALADEAPRTSCANLHLEPFQQTPRWKYLHRSVGETIRAASFCLAAGRPLPPVPSV